MRPVSYNETRKSGKKQCRTWRTQPSTSHIQDLECNSLFEWELSFTTCKLFWFRNSACTDSVPQLKSTKYVKIISQWYTFIHWYFHLHEMINFVWIQGKVVMLRGCTGRIREIRGKTRNGSRKIKIALYYCGEKQQYDSAQCTITCYTVHGRINREHIAVGFDFEVITLKRSGRL